MVLFTILRFLQSNLIPWYKGKDPGISAWILTCLPMLTCCEHNKALNHCQLYVLAGSNSMVHLALAELMVGMGGERMRGTRVERGREIGGVDQAEMLSPFQISPPLSSLWTYTTKIGGMCSRSLIVNNAA